MKKILLVFFVTFSFLVNAQNNNPWTTQQESRITNNDKLVKEFGIEYRDFLIDNAKQYTDRNLMIIDDNNIRISREGLFISDAIMRDLMHV